MRIPKRLLKSFQNLKRLRLPFFGLTKAFIPSFKSTALNSRQSHPSNLYRHCSELSLDGFLDCLLNHNLNRLIKFGIASLSQLPEAWENIYTEYCDISGGTQYRHLVNLRNDYHAILAKREAIRLALLVLSQRFSLKMVQLLRDYGYSCTFNWDDPDAYRKDLDYVFAKSRTLEITLQLKKLEYDKLIASFEKKEVTITDWNLMIGQVEKFMAFHINRKEVTVSEFAAYKKMMELQYEADKKELDKLNKHHKSP